ncbi:MAG: thioesterase domain-containing protein, partial [Flammeovirgaceae bacterium]
AGIDQAVVVPVGVGDAKYLVCYYVSSAGVLEQELKAYLSGVLLEYMVPSVYVRVDEFGLTSSGKLDYRRLPKVSEVIQDDFQEAETEMEHALVALWSAVLEMEASSLGVTHSFFELGGNSLKAMVLINRMNKAFSIQLLLRDIFQHQTIRALSSKIESGQSTNEVDEMIVALNHESAKEKLFMIHDGSGEVDGYLELARHLDQYACYGMRYNSHFTTAKEAPEVVEIAATYIQEIKKIQPEGPYRLIGWSLGGVIAKEITAQLEQNEEQVERLMIIDTAFPFSNPAAQKPFNIASEVEFVKNKFGITHLHAHDFNAMHEVWLEFFNSAVFKETALDEVRQMIPEAFQLLIPDFENKDAKEAVSALNKIRLLMHVAKNSFTDAAIETETLYIQPADSHHRVEQEQLNALFKNLQIRSIAGDHFSVMKSTHVEPLAALIKSQLGNSYREYII